MRIIFCSQFFANREAAQMFKARYEGDLLGGGLGLPGQGRPVGQPARGVSDSVPTGEDRVAFVKAEKERAKEREAAEKEAQVCCLV